MIKLDNLDWYCSDCKEKCAQYKNEKSKLREEKADLYEENKLLRERLAVLESRIEDIKQEVKEEIKAEVGEAIEKVLEEFKEHEDKKSRKSNLVIYNVLESSKIRNEDREQDDVSVCHRIFRDGVKEKDYTIIKAIRIGKKAQGSNIMRPLLVKLATARDKWNIIKKTNNFRLYQDDDLK